MSSKLFLVENSIDNRWKVIDKQGFCFGDGATREDAIQSARIVADDPIIFGATYEMPEKIVKNIDDNVQSAEDTIISLAELAGFEVFKVYDDNLKFKGYSMELIE